MVVIPYGMLLKRLLEITTGILLQYFVHKIKPKPNYKMSVHLVLGKI